MPRPPNAVRLPPLSFESLNSVREFERHARDHVRDCYRDSVSNLEAAISILRTDILITFGVRHNYYSRLPDYRPEWLDEIKRVTIASMLANVTGLASADETRRISQELHETIEDDLKARAKGQYPVAPQLQAKAAPEQEPLSEQLSKLRIESRLTHETLAEGVHLSVRSVHRHLSGEAIPSLRHVNTYEVFFSNRLKKQVKLKRPPALPKTSSKRH